MKFVQIVVLLLMIVVAVNAEKVRWDENGNPIITKTNKPIKGCNQGGLESLGEDSNKTKDCS